MTGSKEAPTTRPDRGVVVHAFGLDSILVELPAHDVATTSALDAYLRQQELSGIIDIVPAEDTLLLQLDHPRRRSEHEQLLAQIRQQSTDFLHTVGAGTATAVGALDSDTAEIPVVYDGEDIEQVARACTMSVAELIEVHASTGFTVAFCGFAPGFAYLTGLPDSLHLPRRATPRTQVPAGSVAIAEHYSAVYPRASPGGWHLLGRTDRTLFDPRSATPALLQPGMHVRFVPISDRIEITSPPISPDRSESHDSNRQTIASPQQVLRIVDPGASCLIEDLGRSGWGRVAVAASGAWDRRSHRLGQRLVGNPEQAAGLECLGGGLRLAALAPLIVAVTGAPGSVTIHSGGGSRPAPALTPLHLDTGEELLLGHPTEGLRRYVAIRGGLSSERVMGSASTDTLSGLGPPPVAAGMAFGFDPVTAATIGPIPAVDLSLHETVDRRVGVIPGPAWSLLDEESRRHLADGDVTVSSVSDRVGVRLEGVTLEWQSAEDPRTGHISRTSRPLIRGAIQLPSDGRPVVMGPDHPATGGYPVIAVLADPDAPAQWLPGLTLRLQEVVPFLLATRAASSTGRAADS